MPQVVTVCFFADVGNAEFELTLFPDEGGVIYGKFPDAPAQNAINFGAFINNNEQCTGLPVGAACNIGTVGTVDGARLTATLNNLTFTIPSDAREDGGNNAPVAANDEYVVTGPNTLNVGCSWRAGQRFRP